uniref:transposase n=2 Tax=Ilumatobacter sp. TaxID=1967498 RepID=UPI00375255AD
DDAWIDIDYTLGGYAQVAETTYEGGGRRKKDRRTVRLVVRRTRLADTAQARLFPEWRHHSFITNYPDLTAIEADRFHRNHAIVELVIRELKNGGATHIPSGHYAANAAWFACAVIAHNLARWTVTVGAHEPVNTRTLRVRIIAVPAVAVNRSGRRTLRFPSRWPWRDDFTTMLTNLRALPGPAG